MIIYVEGIACAGKTAFIRYLKRHSRIASKIKLIEELPSSYYSLNSDLDDFCKKNDERKCMLAKKLSDLGFIVLVDRSYVSTLTYNFIEYQNLGSNEYFSTLNWYLSHIGSKLVKPNFYIYISVSKSEVDQRFAYLSRKKNRNNKYDPNKAWFLDPETGLKYYLFFFSKLDPDTPILNLNGTDEHSTQLRIFEDFITRIENQNYDVQ